VDILIYIIEKAMKGIQAKANSKLNLQEYKQRKIILESYPQYVMIELTRGCNLRCPMCRDSNKEYSSQRLQISTLEKIEMSGLLEKAKLVDLRGWGESLILKGIDKIISRVAKTGAQVRFVTNLSYKVAPVVLETLAKYNCYVDISLDSSDPQILKKVRRGADLSVISSNLSSLLRMYSEYHGDTGRVGLTSTVQYPSLKSLHELILFAASHRVQKIKFFPVDVDIESTLSLQGKDCEVDEFISKAKHLAKIHKTNVLIGSKLGSTFSSLPSTFTCIHPWSYCSISFNGDVGFCDHLIGPTFDSISMGNINSSSFQDIWNGEKWQGLRLNHLQSKCGGDEMSSHCTWCYQNKYIDFEDMFDPSLSSLKVFL
jgi:radical SAM protein with 4Fe4S-binding SPASM domain